MKGLISREHGPQLTDILRLLSQADHPTLVRLRSRAGDDSATLSLHDGLLINATRGNATGMEALVRIASVPEWHFESFDTLEDDRQDFEPGREIAELISQAQATAAGPAEDAADSRHILPFVYESGKIHSETASRGQRDQVLEEIGFLDYYAKELSESLGFGEVKAMAVTSRKVSAAMQSAGGQEFRGLATFRSFPAGQLLSQVSGSPQA